jgi:tRNA G18 (ribose-2'-O)-methylase SpoU
MEKIKKIELEIDKQINLGLSLNKLSNKNFEDENLFNEIEQKTIDKPNFYVLIYNLSKAKNIDILIRSANSFGCSQIYVLGGDKKVLNKFYKMKNNENKHSFKFFNTVEELSKYCSANYINIVGVEIGENSKPINKYSFTGHTLFVLGNEGVGMNKKQKELCQNNLVYIPQFSNTTASLNVAVAASIIFYHFSKWAKYNELKY